MRRRGKKEALPKVKKANNIVEISTVSPLISIQQPPKKEVESKGTFKRSGHLTDQILSYDYPPDKKGQLTIWDSLGSKTKDAIERAGIERSEIVEGIKLNPSETKIIDNLCKVLHERSQTNNPEESDYYAGNSTPEVMNLNGENAIAPKLTFTLYELTKEYKGGNTISGKDVENVAKTLQGLSKKQFLLKYKETTHDKKGGKTVKELELYQRLINLPNFREIKYNKEGIETSKTEETLVVLHPIFNRQIDSKFILYPNDITKRTAIAYGSHNVSDITLRLRDYLLRLLSNPKLTNKKFEKEVMLDKFYYMLSEKWMKEKRKSKVRQYTNVALETMVNLGLLKSYKLEEAKTTGEPKIVLAINKDFE